MIVTLIDNELNIAIIELILSDVKITT